MPSLFPYSVDCTVGNKPYNVLFLCTGNSARSVFAEALLNHFGKTGLKAYSAGSQPKGQVHPAAIKVLQEMGISTDHFRSKSWNEFAVDSAPNMDVMVTVCDNAAAEACPVRPAHSIVAHWSIPGPAAMRGSEDDVQNAFQQAYITISGCIHAMIETMLNGSDNTPLRDRLNSFDPSGEST